MVIYGNTAEDLGQFNIEFDDSSITNLVSSAEGKLEDLPLALHSTNLTIEESISALNTLSLPVTALDLSIEVKQLLQLMLKVCELPNLGDALHKLVSTVVSAATSYVTCSWGRSIDCEELHNVLSEARTDLIELYKSFKEESWNASAESLEDSEFFDLEADLATSKQLVGLLSQYFCFSRDFSSVGHHQLPQVNEKQFPSLVLFTFSIYNYKTYRNKDMLLPLSLSHFTLSPCLLACLHLM